MLKMPSKQQVKKVSFIAMVIAAMVLLINQFRKV